MTILDSDKCTDGKQIRKYFLEKREKKKRAFFDPLSLGTVLSELLTDW